MTNPRPTASLPTPYYDHAGITIYHGDCREILPHLDPSTFTCLVTDPPYGLNYRTSRATNDPNQDRSVLGDDSTELRDWVLAQWGGHPAIVFGSWKRPRPKSTRALLVWDKGPNAGMGDLSLPWKPNTEEIYILGVGFHGHRGTSVLSVFAPAPQSNFRKRLHPTEKPIALITRLLQKCPAGAILDPFMGSGTTLRAAKDLGRKAIGIEIEEKYCEIAAKRLAQEVLPL